MEKPTLKIQFDTQEQLKDFAIWLCNKGEDHYEECGGASGDYKPVRLIYHHPQDLQYADNDKRRFANATFIKDNTILTENYG